MKINKMLCGLAVVALMAVGCTSGCNGNGTTLANNVPAVVPTSVVPVNNDKNLANQVFGAKILGGLTVVAVNALAVDGKIKPEYKDQLSLAAKALDTVVGNTANANATSDILKNLVKTEVAKLATNQVKDIALSATLTATVNLLVDTYWTQLTSSYATNMSNSNAYLLLAAYNSGIQSALGDKVGAAQPDKVQLEKAKADVVAGSWYKVIAKPTIVVPTTVVPVVVAPTTIK